MKRIAIFLLMLLSVCAAAQDYSGRHAGLDRTLDWSVAPDMKAPRGYKAAFIEHYGRHGSRYAYSSEFYVTFRKALDKGEELGVLTELGKSIKADFDSNYDNYILRTGDLSTIGFSQLEAIGEGLAKACPSALCKGARVYAGASASTRSIMSMSAFCVGLSKVAPGLDILEEQGKITLDATNPRDRNNPYRLQREEPAFPFTESLDDFQERKLPCRTVLQRLFTDVDAVFKESPVSPELTVRNMYVLAVGMNSIPVGERTDFSGMFTQEELELMWEVDNYQRFGEYFSYVPRIAPVALDMIRDADARLANGERGLTARFGHDHVMMPLLCMFGFNEYRDQPTSPDDVARVFQTWDSPMATNLLLVFYTPKKAGKPVLVRVLQNWQEVSFGPELGDGPFYEWTLLKTYLRDRVGRYPVVGE